MALHGRMIVLGTGTSFGVPVVGCECATCTSDDPHDRRTRVSAVVTIDGGPTLLIDTAPELRLQLIAAGIQRIDAVLYTHDHADHSHGIDDLRALSGRNGRLPIYGPPEVLARLAHRFNYIFDDAVQPPEGTSKPELAQMPIDAGVEVEIAGVPVLPLEADHGTMRVYGYRVGSVAYLTDVKRLPEATVARLHGLEGLVVNALFETPHPTHLSIPEAVQLAKRLGARQTWLTHIPHRHRHRELAARLPAGVAPAYDGLVVPF